jgi:hypothetical protein
MSGALNGAAYRLAKEVLSISEEHGLFEEVPQYIFDIISVECCT